MARHTNMLILQAVGPEAALLRLLPDSNGQGCIVEMLGQWRCAERGRDGLALSDPAVLAELTQCVRAGKLGGRPVRVLLGGHSIACHRLALPALPREAAHKAIRLKLSNILPYDMALASLAIDPPTARGSEFVYRVVSAPANTVRAACDALVGAGLVVEDLHPAPAAVESLLVSRMAKDDTGPVAAAFIGESATTLVICHNGAAAAVNELPCALADLTAALMRPIIAGENSITLAEAEARTLRNTVGIPAIGSTVESLGVPAERVLPLLEPVLQQWARALTQWLTFASTSEVRQPITKLIISGPGAVIPGLARAMNGRVPVTVESDESATRGVLPREGHSLTEIERAAFAPSTHAVALRYVLPSLLPPELRRTRRVASGMRVAGLCGTALAAACVVATATLWRIGGGLAQTLAAQESEMVDTRKQLHDLRGLLEQTRRVERLHQEMTTFSQCTPQWTGLLKELARALPPAIVLRQVHVERKNDWMVLQLTARVYCDDGASSFDGLMQSSLRELQASDFFERVEVVSAQQPSRETLADAGELRLRMRVVHATTLKHQGNETAK